ncbi:MAG: hypothetical protein JXA51_04475 [Dehalococcoidales bacterium]|nr:hypothetical protein [Dehalococcoidales bacterium]
MKISVKDFFQDFYDSQVFHPVIAGQDMKWTYIDTAYDSVVKIDRLFTSVDRNTFRKEMIALRMEMIGLVFTHNIKKKEQLLNQSLFTKDYLDENAQSEIWDIMGEYNQSIAMSTDIGKNEKELIETNERRMSLFEEYMNKYHKDDMDITCIARICNREGCEVAWEKQYTLMRLMSRFAARVECSENINQDALTTIISVIWGFYQGAKEAIKSVNFE